MSKFGNRISGGLGHQVFEHPEDPTRILKKPTRFRRLFEAGYEQTADDVAFMQEHYGPWVPATTVHRDDQFDYVIEQVRLQNPHHVTAAGLHESDRVLESLIHLLDQNRAMMSRHGVSIDTYGFFGLLRSLRHSIVRRVREKCMSLLHHPVLPSAPKPELANVLIGNTSEVENRSPFVVDCSLLHLHRGGLEGIRSKTLLALHNTMLKQQFGLTLRA